DTARHFDEPFGDMSILPTRMVAQMASKHVKVALTGDGGDEVFAGYNSYWQALRIWGSGYQRDLCKAHLTLMEWLWERKLRWQGFPKGFTSFESKISKRLRQQLYKSTMPDRRANRIILTDRQKWYYRVQQVDLLSAMQYLAFHTWLPDAFLRKVDMMSMAHSLECRSPLLDYRIIELAARLPFEAKMGRDGRGKVLLRHLLARHLPQKLFERPKKGFDIPWANWCKDKRRKELQGRWLEWDNPWFNQNASKHLFPESQLGNDQLQWTAFSFLETMVK
ncbi:MAG: hypothetical protein EOM12_09370, partial [Verrucomicrobiae bacterium]|nr:hypothetical protein [Verrucomicrobiae bacterium]